MSETNAEPWSLPAERVIVLVMTLIAAALRFSQFTLLGIDHFDEGIYATAGAWSLRPGGLGSIEPGLIAYSPPGYPFLVGLAYAMVGPSDRAAIAISILAGVATIPAVGWLGRRTLGPGGGIAAASFATASGIQIVLSRMALTDATLGLVWIAGIGLGGRFLERPGPARGLALGLAVGVAQLVKYNGWLIGAIVIATALVGLIVSPTERSRPRWLRVFGWGALAATVAILVDWPWVRFVEAHGGYSSLLAHQRSYLGRLSEWPGHLATQLRQRTALGPGNSYGFGLALFGLSFSNVLGGGLGMLRRWGVVAILLGAILLGNSTSGWWLGLAVAPLTLRDSRPVLRMLGAWWLVMTLLTPCYHPYARLWLPLEAVGWFFQGASVLVLARRFVDDQGEIAAAGIQPGKRFRRLAFAAVTAGFIQAWMFASWSHQDDLFNAPNNSHRDATARLLSAIPDGVGSVVLLGRPTIRFYAGPALAARRIKIEVMPGLEALFGPGVRPGRWAIIDSALLIQEGPAEAVRIRLLAGWEIVAEVPSQLSIATLLDLDPMADVHSPAERSCPLLLLRRKPEAMPP